MKQKLILTRGAPASGKTTWTKNFMSSSKGQNFVNVNRDDLRVMLFPNHYNEDVYKPSNKRESMVTQAQMSIATDAIEDDMSVIVSDTNLREDTVEGWRKLVGWFNEYGYDVEFEIKDFYEDLDVLLERNAKRANGVPPKVIHDMYYRHVEQVYPDWKVEPDENLPPAIIVDVDGTLANHEGVRSPYDASRVSEDKPHWDIMDLVTRLSVDHYVIIMTGRDGSARQDTQEWLNDYGVEWDAVYIRAEGDTRKDSIIKKELFDEHVRGKYNVRYVIDDRRQVIFMWRALGLRVLDVAGGEF